MLRLQQHTQKKSIFSIYLFSGVERVRMIAKARSLRTFLCLIRFISLSLSNQIKNLKNCGGDNYNTVSDHHLGIIYDVLRLQHTEIDLLYLSLLFSGVERE